MRRRLGSLSRYRRKRDFSRTPEPSGRRSARRRELSYFVQRHEARHLHFDFRLELDGVLKSWAVPKGVSLDPSVRRLAVHVEDHPLSYGAFQGTIPKGEYGAGKVEIWDRGVWIPENNPEESYRRGKMVFRLAGEKLNGRFSLIRFKSSDDEPGKDYWLLRMLKNKSASRRPAPAQAADLPGARRAPLLLALQPEQATLVASIPDSAEWLHEIKLDGYRFIATVDTGKTTLTTRAGHDWSSRLPTLARELASLPVKRAVLDGEVVALSPEGKSDFGALQDALAKGAEKNLIYYAFDLLYQDGYDLRDAALGDRKRRLKELLGQARSSPHLQYSDHVEGQGAEFYRGACELGLEGVVSKRRNSAYHSGRGHDWVKVKCLKRQEFVVGGYTDPKGSRPELGSLLLGIYQGGALKYAGRVGTGFSRERLAQLKTRLRPLERGDSPYSDEIPTAERRGVHWTEPELVVEVSFSNWTPDGRLRHPVLVGLREDKKAEGVVLEVPRRGLSKSGRLTHPDRLVYPELGITKRDLARFYEDLAPWILPHVAGRPLSLVRCPQGAGKACFYQKHPMEASPEALKSVQIEGKEGVTPCLYIEDEAGLVALVQMGGLEIHPWGSRIRDLEHPDRCVFDLDPGPGVPWKDVVHAAHELRGFLRDRSLESFVKTTGGKGLHIVVPFTDRPGWPALKAWSRRVADELVRRWPDRYTVTLSKAARPGKIFIDALRNVRGATAVGAYSARAKPGAPVATPLAWDELTPALKSDRYTVRNLFRRLGRLAEDPWKRMFQVKQRMEPPA